MQDKREVKIVYGKIHIDSWMDAHGEFGHDY